MVLLINVSGRRARIKKEIFLSGRRARIKKEILMNDQGTKTKKNRYHSRKTIEVTHKTQTRLNKFPLVVANVALISFL